MENETKEEKEQRVRQFLEELTALSRKYKLCVSGCGCCESPYLEEAGEDYNAGDHVYGMHLFV